MKELITLIDRWESKRALVVGDFMLDQSVFGNAERLSPDAPVPVLKVVDETAAPGGAANVCRTLAALKCEVTCLGLVGDDAAGNQLVNALREAGCGTDQLIIVEGRPTIVKRNMIGLAQHRHPQKMFRVDYEDNSPLDEDFVETLFDHAVATMRQADVLLLEDYNKGLLTEDLCQRLIAEAKAANLPVYVDPAPITDYGKYRGCTCMTPNRTEAELATGCDVETETHKMATQLLNQLEMEAVALTLDRHGSLLQVAGEDPVPVPTQAREVYDVTGAGDVFFGTMAMARANGASWVDATSMANFAAGLEVEQFAMVPIPLQQIHSQLIYQQGARIGKVRTLKQLLPELEAHRWDKKRIAFTNGCFDILHAGHVELLRAARQTADLLVLAVNTDKSIRRLKGDKRPIVTEAERVMVLSELSCVDYIVLFGDDPTEDPSEKDTPVPLIRGIQPDVLIKGAQYNIEDVLGRDIVEEHGGEVVLIPHVEGMSTTNIVDKIRGQS